MSADREERAATYARGCPMCGAALRGIYCSSSACCLGGRSPWGPGCTMTETEARAVLGFDGTITGDPVSACAINDEEEHDAR